MGNTVLYVQYTEDSIHGILDDKVVTLDCVSFVATITHLNNAKSLDVISMITISNLVPQLFSFFFFFFLFRRSFTSVYNYNKQKTSEFLLKRSVLF